MENYKEKLIELIRDIQVFGRMEKHENNSITIWSPKNEELADHLLANGVTFATDTNDGRKWRPASEPPEEPMEYIVMIKGGANATTLLFDGRLWFEEYPEGWRTYYEITHWMPLPEPPKEVKHE